MYFADSSLFWMLWTCQKKPLSRIFVSCLTFCVCPLADIGATDSSGDPVYEYAVFLIHAQSAATICFYSPMRQLSNSVSTSCQNYSSSEISECLPAAACLALQRPATPPTPAIDFAIKAYCCVQMLAGILINDSPRTGRPVGSFRLGLAFCCCYCCWMTACCCRLRAAGTMSAYSDRRRG